METQLTKKKRHEELILEAKNFFDAHKKEIGPSIRSGEKIIRIPWSLLSEFNKDLADNVLDDPQDILAIMETALEETGLVKNPRVRFSELPKAALIKIREIRAKNLDKMIWIEGIVRQASDVRPQVVN